MNHRKHYRGMILPALVAAVVLSASTARGDDAAEIIKSIVRDAKTSAEAAAQLVAAAKTIKDVPEMQMGICVEAYNCGVKSPAGYESADQALKILYRVAPDRAKSWDQKRLNLYQLRYANTRTHKRQYAEELVALLLSTAAKCEGRDNWQEALKLYRQAAAVATYQRLSIRTEIQEKIRVAAARQTLQARVKHLEAELAKAPDNAKVRDSLIRTCLMDLDSPQRAAKYLNDDVDELFRTYIPLAAGPISELKEPACLELGQWYKSLADGTVEKAAKVIALKRAQRYLERYLVVHTEKDGAMLKATLILGQVTEAIEKLDTGAALPSGVVRVLTFEKANWIKKKSGFHIRDSINRGRDVPVFRCEQAPGIAGGGIRLSGSYAFVDTGIRQTGKTVTFAFWAKTGSRSPSSSSSPSSSYSYGVLFGQYGQTDYRRYTYRYNRFYVGLSSGRLYTYVGSEYLSDESGKAIEPGWHHYTIVTKPTAILVYVDGKPRLKKQAKRAVELKGTYYLGACNRAGYSSGGYSSFSGLTIDEVAVFTRALSSREIQRLIDIGKKGKPLVK